MQKFFVNNHRPSMRIGCQNVRKRVCNVYTFRLSFHFAYHHWWLGFFFFRERDLLETPQQFLCPSPSSPLTPLPQELRLCGPPPGDPGGPVPPRPPPGPPVQRHPLRGHVAGSPAHRRLPGAGGGGGGGEGHRRRRRRLRLDRLLPQRHRPQERGHQVKGNAQLSKNSGPLVTQPMLASHTIVARSLI